MQKIFVAIAFMMSVFFVRAQTFNGTGGTIPGSSTTQTCWPITVTGVGNINTVSNGLASVCIKITHPYVDELEVVLKAPDGTVVPLTIQNGGSGNDYTNTCFSNSATTSIKFGTAPFSGSFIPEGYLGSVNNGQNANGTWSLCIQDRRTGANQGVLNSWSLTFSNTPAAAAPVFPACANTLPSTSSCANATAICDFNGLCGSTAGSSVQDWPGSGLTGCFGLQNNSFIKFIAAANTATFTVWVPTSSSGPSGGIQMLFFSGTCDAGAVTSQGCYPHIFPYQSASNPLPTIISTTGLTPGNTYYLMFDGFNNDNCTFRIAANSGVNVLTINPTAPGICNGQSVNLTASGSDGSYSWTPAAGLNTTTGATVTASPVTNTTYTVNTTTSTGCVLTEDVTVTVNDVPVITPPLVADTIAVCQNGTTGAFSVNAVPGSGTIAGYQWYVSSFPFNRPGTLLPFATNPTYTPSSATTGELHFYCKVTNSNGCSDTSDVAAVLIVKAAPVRPVVTAAVGYCQNATAAQLTATGSNLLWYTTLTGGTGSSTAPTPVTTTAASTIYYVSQTTNGCESQRASITVTVTATPAAPTVNSSIGYCENATPSVLTATGSNLLWYTTLTGGTGSASAPTPVTTSIGNTVYYVSQTVNGCESPRAAITVTITAIPAAPTVSNPPAYCQNATASVLTATGSNLLWYSNSSGGVGSATAPTPSTVSALNTNYYVSQTVNGCESPRAMVTVTVTATPAAPTVSNPAAYCQNAAASVLTATGNNLLWYITLTGGTGTPTAPTPSTNTASSTIYYVSQTTNGCESPRAAITVTVNATPAAPGVNNAVGYCQNAASSVLTATGSNLLWYTTLSGGTGAAAAPTPSTAATGNTIYYVSQTVNGCESPRVSITVAITTQPPAPAVSNPAAYCQNATASALTATGSNLLWYTTLTGGTGSAAAPTPSTTIATNTNYYVSQTVNVCESPRATITVTVNPTPAAPSVNSPVSYCQNAASSVLTATGTNLLWYSTLTGGTGTVTAPVPATTTAGNIIYYVSQTTNGCESPRAAITVTVNSTPALPPVTSPVGYCQNAVPLPLSATGTNLLWYTTLSGGTGSSQVIVPSTTTVGNINYYVSQTINGCESPRATITVNIGAAPLAPSVISPVIYCQNAAAIALSATGTSLLWYNTASGGTGSSTAPTPVTTTAGNTIYYVSQTINGCEGVTRAAITVTVKLTPAAPAVNSTVAYCQNGTATALSATGSNLLWYTVASGGTGNAAAPTPATTSTGNTNYYVSQTINGCEGPRALITVTVNTILPAPLVTSPVVYCQDATATVLSAAGSNLLWYTNLTGGTGTFASPTPATTIAGNVNYYVSQSSSGCESPRATIAVTVNPTALAPTVVSPVTYCQNTAAVPLTATGTNLLWYTMLSGGTGSATAPTPSTAIPGNTFYYVTQTGSGCESPRRAITVTVNVTSTAVAGFHYTPDTVCLNGINPVPAYDLGFTNGGNFVSTPAGLSINSATGDISLAASAIGTYTVTYTYNKTGCVNGNSAAVNITLIPAVNTVTVFSYSSPVCKNAANVLPQTSPGFTTGGTFSSSPGISLNSSTGEVDIAGSAPGQYMITYRLAPLGCRQGTTNFSFITVVDTTSAVTSFSYSSTDVCISSGINPTISKPANFSAGGTFASVPAGLNINAASGAINIGLSVPGVYKIAYTIPALACQLPGRDSLTFILRTYGNPVTSFSYFSPVCKGDDTATAVKDIAFTPGGVFTATPNGLAIDAISGIVKLAQSLAGTYDVRYDVAQGVCNPVGFGNATIQVLDLPESPVVSAMGICGPGTISLSAVALGTVSWYTDPGLLNQVNVGNSYNTTINTTTPFYVTNTIGTCESVPALLNAVVSPVPVKPFIGKDTAICSNDKLILNAGTYNGYLWQDGSANSTYTVSNAGFYKVVVSTGVGCTDSASINVTLLANCDDILFPNAFSPGGANRTFGALGNLVVVSNYTLRIFNRYGEVVFVSADPAQRWDGTYKGKPVNIGTYVYVASYFYKSRYSKMQKGTVTLIR